MAQLHMRRWMVCLIAASLAGLSGCRTATVQAIGAGARSGAGAGDPMSGPPTFNEKFQARNPRVCRAVTTPPTPEEAKALVQCNYEAHSIMDGYSANLVLTTDVQVQIGRPRPFTIGVSSDPQTDTKAMVYDLRGQATEWSCAPAAGIYAPGENCSRFAGAPGGTGECWRTTFGDWKCDMTIGGGTETRRVKAPTTY